MLESADRVLRVLEAFSPTKRDLTLSEIADQLGLPRSSVHRLLAVLIAHGFIERDPATRRYRLGIRLFEIGSIVIHQRGLHSAAHPVVEELSVSTGETCHLAVLSGIEAVYVYKIEGASSIIMSSRVGGRAPAHCTSIGKVLLAWSGREVVEQVVAGGLRPYTLNTITSPEQLEVELERVRAQGYAIDVEEYERGLCCIAAPVRDHSGAVIAALGLAGPRSRLGPRRLTELAGPVRAAADAVSRNLGYIPAAVVAGS
ncbi:MAG TPA: IclR family transcriptional regulator [Candidatus Dormibacteraeota bacterium]|nr:IclR family transcriptional regulator [Candidatus Dormibacteraeota bacterium]